MPVLNHSLLYSAAPRLPRQSLDEEDPHKLAAGAEWETSNCSKMTMAIMSSELFSLT